MTQISLAVTVRVLQNVIRAEANSQAGLKQRQLTIREASLELVEAFRSATKEHQLQIELNGEFKLYVGDPWAIWFTHQDAGLQADDFNSLYDLLSRRPERPVDFPCRICNNTI